MATWEAFTTECKKCARCKGDGLLDPRAFPILMKDPPQSTDILFILEAPNRKDTYDPKKGHLTIEPDTDPSGALFHDLFVHELRFPIEHLFVTNSVLCLPAPKKGKYPVMSRQQSNCRYYLERMIEVFNPLVVCPLGAPALLAAGRLSKHGYKTIGAAVAKRTSWYGRTLFPLSHTSRQARNSRNGRPEYKQRADWRNLRAVWQELKTEE